MNFITEPIANILQFLFSMTGSLGWSIILLTIIIRTLLVPLVVPSMKQQVVTRKKLKAIKPELAALKTKFKNDPMKLSQAQMELYKKNDIKLFSWGILLPIVQIVFLIALYQVLLNFLNGNLGLESLLFYGINLAERDSSYVLIALSVLTQLFLSLMILPGVSERPDVIPDNSKSKKIQKLNEVETDQQEMAETITQQMLFFMPIMTGFFAFTFPSGVVLYWIATTVFSVVQQYFISGWGGVEKYIPWLKRQA